MKFDLFNELLQTVADFDDGITYSHCVHIPALGKLYDMADYETVDRCLAKLREERKELKHENL